MVSTHSPQVLSEVKAEQVFLIEDFKLIKAPPTFGRDSNSILAQVMDVGERPEQIQKQLNHCVRLIDQEYYDKARSLIEKLERDLGPDDPELVRANAMLAVLDEK